jgi:hypothetical protein
MKMAYTMERINEALKMATDAYEKEFGGTEMEIGEDFAAVFNDAVLVIEMDEGRELSIRFALGAPYRFDYSLNDEEATP